MGDVTFTTDKIVPAWKGEARWVEMDVFFFFFFVRFSNFKLVTGSGIVGISFGVFLLSTKEIVLFCFKEQHVSRPSVFVFVFCFCNYLYLNLAVFSNYYPICFIFMQCLLVIKS